MSQADFNLFVSRVRDYFIPKSLGNYTVFAFLNGDSMTAVGLKLEELRPPTRRQSHRFAPEVHSQERPTRRVFLPSVEHRYQKTDVECGVLYLPEVENSPLVEGFFFVESNPMTLVGLRTNTAGGHHTTTSAVRHPKERLAA
ncbi:retrotransposon hot spot protein (RHS), putative, partial [Trypanosoma cruzi]